IQATCTDNGYIVYKCARCDFSDYRTIPALGHDMSMGSYVPPTCTEDGYIEYECRRCWDYYRDIIPALGHDMSMGSYVPPTCTEDGYREYECTRCWDFYRVIIPAPGHDFEFYPSDTPSCYTGGVQSGTYVCIECGYTEGVSYPAYINHIDIRESYTLEPTCCEDGYIEYMCYACWRYNDIEIIPATGIHTPGEWVVVCEPAAGVDGLRILSCTVCDTVLESEIIPCPNDSVVTVTSDCETVMIGECFDTYVSVDECDPVKSIAFVPVYDSAAFELVSVEWLIPAMLQITDPEIIAAWMDETDINGNVLKFTFRAKGVAANSEISVEVYAQNTDDLQFTVVSDNVTVIECIHETYEIVSVDDSSHRKTCILCGYGFTAAHTYEYACDADCNECGYIREVTHTPGGTPVYDGAEHWYNCTECGEPVERHSHEYDDHLDSSCKDCGYVRVLRGDVDGDGDVDSDDSIRLLLYVYAPDSYELFQYGDMDGDGDIDSDDSVRVLLYIYFPSEYPLTGEV
ncbi:MAG: hypothetical protein IKU19_05665, partial [Clostridia bacterium]|nr:hypothetical protein [Clostridia bacterium]